MSIAVVGALGRFDVLEEIGRGAQGITYRARDREKGALVALKVLRLRDSADWKAVELFEREGRALQSLEHEGIPKYIDAFQSGEGEKSFVLVQEFVEGEDLGTLIAQGLRMGEAEVRGFLSSMLGILAYLHGLERPVIHRDIKPSNIMRRVDGRWVLIDFGAVQLGQISGAAPRGATTVVGTTGYMPFEQILGVAVPASDLYALGATMVHVLSHRHPNDLPVDESDHMRLLFAPFVTVSPQILGLLEGMLEPVLDERVRTAQEALAILEGKVAVPVRGRKSPEEKQGRGAVEVVKKRGVLKRTRNLAASVVGKYGSAEAFSVVPMPGVMEVSSEAVSFRLGRLGSDEEPGCFQILGTVFTFLVSWVIVSAAFVTTNLFPSLLWALSAGLALVVGGFLVKAFWRRRIERLVVTQQFVEIDYSRRFLGLLGLKKRVLGEDVLEIGVVPVPVLGMESGYRVRLGTEGGKNLYFGRGLSEGQGHWLALKIEEAVEVLGDG